MSDTEPAIKEDYVLEDVNKDEELTLPEEQIKDKPVINSFLKDQITKKMIVEYNPGPLQGILNNLLQNLKKHENQIKYFEKKFSEISEDSYLEKAKEENLNKQKKLED